MSKSLGGFLGGMNDPLGLFGKKSSTPAPAAAPAPAAPAAPEDAPLRAQRAGQLAAGAEIASSDNVAGEGEVDMLGQPKRRAASRSILG